MVATWITVHMNCAAVAYFWASMESFMAKSQKRPSKQIEVTSSEMNIQMKMNIILWCSLAQITTKKTHQKTPNKVVRAT